MSINNTTVDILVIGGGLVGLSTAYQCLKLHPGSGVLVLEKEQAVCTHQSGRNSGVIHSGVYYRPGTLKAINCARGKKLLEQFCEENHVPWRQTGKVIVATSRDEIPRLEVIYERGCANGVPIERLSSEQLKELEPAAAGMLALHVKSSGVADFRGIGEKLRERIEQLGGRVICGAAVQAIESSTAPIRIITTKGDFSAKHMVNCAGLYSDKIFAMCGENPDIRIIPFRGDYFLLNDTAASLCRSLIYPVPNPAFPFLGVHFTRGVYDEVDCGPNAVLAFAREGYTLKRINLRESWESLSYPGFRQLIRSQWREAVRELMLSLSKRLFIKAAQRLIPDIREKDLIAAPSGVRAQAVSRTGKVIDDYVIKFTSNGTHVLNAPSPAATSCLSIGLRLAEQLPLQRGKVVNGTI